MIRPCKYRLEHHSQSQRCQQHDLFQEGLKHIVRLQMFSSGRVLNEKLGHLVVVTFAKQTDLKPLQAPAISYVSFSSNPRLWSSAIRDSGSSDTKGMAGHERMKKRFRVSSTEQINRKSSLLGDLWRCSFTKLESEINDWNH